MKLKNKKDARASHSNCSRPDGTNVRPGYCNRIVEGGAQQQLIGLIEVNAGQKRINFVEQGVFTLPSTAKDR